MFFVAIIEKVVRIEPYELGRNLELKIRQKYAFTLLIIWTSLLIGYVIGLSRPMWALALEPMAISSKYWRTFI
jgi:hypothetical protein